MTLMHWSEQAALPMLLLLQLIPLVAWLLTWSLRRHRLLVPMALVLAGVEFIFAIALYLQFDAGAGTLQFAEQLTLIGPLQYQAAVDGLSILFILVTSLMSMLVIAYSRIRQLDPPGRFIALIFAIEASLMSLFCTIDLLWFGMLSLIQLMLTSRVFDRWSTSDSQDLARQRFLQFMASAMLLLVLSIFMLGWNYANNHAGNWSFSLPLLVDINMTSVLTSVTFFMMLIAFAIRTPVFPVHGWLPYIAEHGTVAVVGIYLVGIKLSIYGILRFLLPLFPASAQEWQMPIIAMAIIGVFYAALLALVQNNLRRLLAFAVISHSGMLFVGLFTLDHTAFVGTVMLAVNFGLALSTMLFMTGFVYKRTHTLLLPRLGGLFDVIPFIGIVFFVAGLSLIGMPGTPGFDAAHLMFESSIVQIGALLTIATALGNVITAGFLLWAFQRAFLAPAAEPSSHAITATKPSEYVIGSIMLLVLLGAGFYMKPWLQLIETSLKPVGLLFGKGH